MKIAKISFWSLFEALLPWAALGFILFCTYALFFLRPYLGITVYQEKNGWVVNDATPANPLKVGDILLQVGDMPGAEAERDLSKGLFASVSPGETVQVTLKRGGQELVLPYTIPGPTQEELFGRLNSQWFIPYIFWLAGWATLLFLRPPGTLRRLLALFYFLNAAWIATSGISGLHLYNGALLLRSLVWLSLPVFLHLHWLFPSPLRPLPGWAWGLLYGVCAVLAGATWLQLVPQSLYIPGFLLAVVGSLILMVVHVIRQPEERSTLSGMVPVLGFILLPVVVTAALAAFSIDIIFSQVVVIGLVALPGFYFFTLYRRQLSPAQAQRAAGLVRAYFLIVVGGLLFCLAFSLYSHQVVANLFFTNFTLGIPLILSVVALVSFIPFVVLPALGDERITLNLGAGTIGFSANRTAAGIIFLTIQILAGLSVFILIRPLNFPIAEPLAIFSALLAAGLLGRTGYGPFRRFFERRVLGMKLAPEALLRTYAARITASLELEPLRRLLLDEVLPSLLVRQFVLLEWRAEALAPLFSLRVEAGEMPAPDSLPALEKAGGTYLRPAANPALPAWVRLVLPLRAAGRLGGFWLLGQRDPDDSYRPAEIETLQALADQTALALVNIAQAEALRALYLADLERHEAERLHLAAELHDDVLNQMGILNLNLQDAPPAAQAAYDQAVAHVREIINGLRPAMLNYGLAFALESLVDDLNDRHPGGARLVLELPRSEVRLPARVELSLFRVIQQACSNAIQHAHAQTIRIQGSLVEDCVDLSVSDDGDGFAASGLVDLPALLAGRHFGLAGMYERAALIGAELSFTSAPAQGTRVRVTWQKPPVQ